MGLLQHPEYGHLIEAVIGHEGLRAYEVMTTALALIQPGTEGVIHEA